MENIKIKNGGHKWAIEFHNERSKKHFIAIPPTECKRIDFIDKNWY